MVVTMVNILIVEDDINLLNIMKKNLEREGYNVFTAFDGGSGLEVLENNHVDLIILDLMLPKLDGFGFTKKVRSEKENLPIIMTTAKSLMEDKRIAFQTGVDDYMTKPFEMEELLLRVKALLRRSKILAEKKIVIGKVIIDCDAMTVTREEEVTELTQKEFALLYKLLSNPNKIFTRNQLMDEIWGYESNSDDRTIDAHINRLRRKFEYYPEFEIKSVRGLGYKVVKNEKN